MTPGKAAPAAGLWAWSEQVERWSAGGCAIPAGRARCGRPNMGGTCQRNWKAWQSRAVYGTTWQCAA